jgi:hypothetical protein
MKRTIIDPNAVIAAQEKIPENTPFVMLNLLHFKNRADYGDRKEILPCSGHEAYLERYIPAFNKAVSTENVTGIKINFIGSVTGLLVAPTDEHWDIIAMVQYPDFATFRKVSESKVYLLEAEPHRLAALEDLRLIATMMIEAE